MNVAEIMNTLHRYHRQLAELQYRVKKGKRQIEISMARVQAVQKTAEGLGAELQTKRLAIKDMENRLKSFEEGVSKRRTQLSEAKSNKEHQALKEQLAHDETVGSALADEALAAMEELEQFGLKVAESNQETARLAELVRKQQKEFEEEMPALAADIEKYAARLAEIEKVLPRDFQEAYKRLVDKLGGEQALAPIVNGSYCGACNTQIPIHYIADICNGVPFVCQACGRLLYIPEGFVIQ